jgi:hypothetical protein
MRSLLPLPEDSARPDFKSGHPRKSPVEAGPSFGRNAQLGANEITLAYHQILVKIAHVEIFQE